MTSKKRIRVKWIAALICAFLFTACGNAQTGADTASPAPPGAESPISGSTGANILKVTEDMITYEADDFFSDWRNLNPNYIELNGSSASIKGTGAKADNGTVTIAAEGVYVLSGRLTNGQIIVDLKDKGTVRLVLNGAEISNSGNAPIYVKNAGKTILTLEEGTRNIIADGESYTPSDGSEEPNAAIFSIDDLTINGNGALQVEGCYNNGIVAKDEMRIMGGTLNIKAKDDGLIGKDMLLMKDGSLTVDAGGDAVKTTNDTDDALGYIAIEGGSFDLRAGSDGIQASTSVLITNGRFRISTAKGSANSIKTHVEENWGKGRQNAPAATPEAGAAEESASAKAIKAKSDIIVKGGTFEIDSADDSVNSNSSIEISGGDMTLSSGDDGIHADSAISIEGGKINITKSYEGIESAVINISGGDIRVVSADDGINVGGGNDGSSVGGRPGQNGFASGADMKLYISGGTIYVDSMGDGLDSNGSIVLTNGTAVVSGPVGNNNGALDYNGTFEMSGGFLIAAGSAGMVQAPSETSAQKSVLMIYPSVQPKGTLLNLQDSSGITIATFAPGKEYQSVLISSPELKENEKYTLYSGGTASGNASNGFYAANGEYKPGTKVVDFTLADAITYLTEAGVATGNQFGHAQPGQHVQPGQPGLPGARPNAPGGDKRPK